MMTHDEMIAVIQHHKHGGLLQFKPKPQTEWYSCQEPNFDFSRFDYRAKPEPMLIYVGINKDGSMTNYDKHRPYCEPSQGTIKKFIEVTE